MRLLDLFCGAGGAAMGYSRAGFDEIVGVDIKPMPEYPFCFQQGDALEFLAEHWQRFDAIHASPPCQGYSIMNNLPWLRDKDYPLLILPTLEMLESIGLPYVIENVMGARHGARGLAKRGLEAHGLKAGWLCGVMFQKPFYRHRLFATNWFWLAPGHPRHLTRIRAARTIAGRARDFVFPVPNYRSERYVYGGEKRGLPGQMAGMNLSQWQNGAQKEGVGVGHAKGWQKAAEAMGIDWMKRPELTQAIPPCYSEYVGRALLEAIRC